MTEETDLLTGENRIMLDEEELKIGFLAQCIEKLAECEQTDYLAIFDRLEKTNMTEGYILKHYNVLHTESMENVIKNLSDILHKREAENYYNLIS